MGFQTYRVLIVDDHPIVRRGLSDLLNETEDLEVCGEAADVSEALQLVDDTHPNAIVVDLTLSSGHGLELIEQVRAKNMGIKMLVSTMHSDLLYAERAVRAGAAGYINKLEAPEKIVTALRQVLRGEMYLSPRVSSRIFCRLQEGKPLDTDPIESLSNRELEVFEMIGRGLPSKRIATMLGLSRKTIDAHREHIKIKLNVKNSLELNRRATQWVLEESGHNADESQPTC